jgi:hypothetical protein
VVHLLERGENFLHRAHEALGHVVERAVGIDHRKFEQAVGIDIGQQSGHGLFSVQNNDGDQLSMRRMRWVLYGFGSCLCLPCQHKWPKTC